MQWKSLEIHMKSIKVHRRKIYDIILQCNNLIKTWNKLLKISYNQIIYKKVNK